MEENQEQKQSRSSQGKGQLTFETKNGEKVEIKKVEYIKEMRWHQWGDGPKDYEGRYVLPKIGYECFDVTVTKDGKSTTKRCYLQIGYNDFKIENAMDDEELAQAVEEFFAPERLEEREQEAKEHNSTYLYMGGIDRDKNGEWYRFRTFPDETNGLDFVYRDIRSDEKKEIDFIASHADSRARVATTLSYSQEEIKEAQTRLDEIIEMDLIDEIKQIKAQLEETQSKLAEHRQKMSMRKSGEIDFSITPKEASNISELISDAEGQVRDDMSRKEPANGLAEEFEQQVRNDLHSNPR